MKEKQNNNQGYHSFQEFLKKFYPSQSERQLEIDDPDEFGARLAQKSLMKLKQLLLQNRLHHKGKVHS